jgi:hypothetical protein
MKAAEHRRAGFLMGILVFLMAPQAHAWLALTNPPSTWQSLPVPYYVENSGCADIGGFDAAVNVCEVSFDTWEGAPCTSWQVQYMGGTSASPMNSRDGQWVQGWVESGWSYGGSAIGVTMSMYGSGVIWGCDIAYNAVNYTWSLTGGSGYTVDSQSIVTHEEGHFLGLNDIYSCLPDPQTMCGYYSGGTGSRTLTDDDISGVCALYPGSGPPPDCTLDTDCDDKYVCIDGTCVGQMCALCTVHEDCGDGDDYCLTGFPDGNFYCGVSCFSDTECGTGNSCIDLGGGVRQCLPTSFDCTGSSTGCTVSTDCPMGYICEAGACVPQPTPECTVNEDCAPGYICVDQHCVLDTSPHNPVCTQCTTNEECGWENDHCITFYPDGQPFSTGLSYCSKSCDSVGGDCGAGFACFEFPDRPAQCLPEDRTCTWCDPVWMTGCGDGYYCDFVNCFSGVCRPGGPGAKPLGDTCSDDLECNSLQCVRQVDESYCSAACSFIPGADSCSTLDPAFTCQPREFGACGYCSCASGRLGDACNRDSDCQSGGCFLLPGQGQGGSKACSMYCGTGVNCLPYFECAYSETGAWGCFPPAGMVLRPGEPCDGTLHCLGGTCDPELGTCTRSCDGKCGCPADMHCEGDGAGGKHCVAGAPEKSGCGCLVIGLDPESGSGAALGTFLLLMLVLGIRIFRKRLFS